MFCDKEGGWKGAVIYLLYNGIVLGLFVDCSAKMKNA